jgi:hypothetical protein
VSDSVNEALRAHVTSVRFVLSLGRTHIASLVWLDLWITVGRDGPLPDRRDIAPPMRRTFDFFVPGADGLMARGLVEHHRFLGKAPDTRPMGEVWEITPAGRHVIGLLRESGIWAEYVAALPPAPEEATP